MINISFSWPVKSVAIVAGIDKTITIFISSFLCFYMISNKICILHFLQYSHKHCVRLLIIPFQ